MSQPLQLLLVTALITAAAIVMLRPRRGLLWGWLRKLRASERVLVEDALKHLHDCEYHQLPATWHSLSGALALSGNRATALLTRLMQLGLAGAESDGTYRLTGDGRRDALRVIRIHRLWERYLSEETGVEAADWHMIADQREHTTSAEEVQALAARMGHPRYDPHGDPIPTAEGELPPPTGVPLSQLREGEMAEVIHIEDEPPAVYAQLLAQGLALGMRVRVFEVTADRVRFEADGEEHVVAPVVAANLSVVRRERAAAAIVTHHSLATLRPGQRGRVIAIAASCRGVARRRFFDLGIVPGTLVEAEFRGPGGDPTAYRIRGATIALRQEQAAQIQIDASEGAVA